MPDHTLAHTVARAPHPALRAYVDPYVGYHHDTGAPGLHRGLPSDRLTVVLAFDEPLDLAWHEEEHTRGRFWTLASGMHSKPVEIRHSGLQHGVQLALTPLGSRALLGLPARVLARELVELDAVLAFPGYDDLAGATWQERFAAVDRALLAAVDAERIISHPELEHAWQLIVRSHGTIRVAEVTNRVEWSQRRLLDRFLDEFGLTPKEAARVARFDRSRRLVTRGVPLAEAAASSGYADQPHLTRDWRALSGYTPTQYLRTEVDPLHAH